MKKIPALAIFVCVGIVIWALSHLKEEPLSSRCNKEPGYGISLDEKKVCILQDISNKLK